MSAGGQFNKPPSGGGMGGGMFGSGGAAMQQPMPAMQQQGMGQSSGLLGSLGQGLSQQTGNQSFGINPQLQGIGGFFNQYNSNPPPGMMLNPTYDFGYSLAQDMPPPGSPQALRKQQFIPNPNFSAPTGMEFNPFYAPRAPGDNTRDYRQTDQMFRPAVMPPIDNELGLMPMPFAGRRPFMGGIPRPLPMPAPFMPTISDETGQYTPPQVMRPDVMPPRVSDETGQFRPPQVILPSTPAAPSGPPAIQSAISRTKDELARMGRSPQARFSSFASRRGRV